MESRKEYKFLLTKKQIAELFNVFENKIETLYPKRVITSLYMDTVDFSIYNNSIFLDVNKFKVRYRTYSSDNSIYEEIKTNTRTYNLHSKDFQAVVTEFWVVSEPPLGAIEISEKDFQHLLQQVMRMKEKTPFRYGNK